MSKRTKRIPGYSFLSSACWFVPEYEGRESEDWAKRLARSIRQSPGEWLPDFYMYGGKNGDRYFIQRAKRNEKVDRESKGTVY